MEMFSLFYDNEWPISWFVNQWYSSFHYHLLFFFFLGGWFLLFPLISERNRQQVWIHIEDNHCRSLLWLSRRSVELFQKKKIIILPDFGFRNFKARGKINLDDDFNFSKIMWRTRHLHRIGDAFKLKYWALFEGNEHFKTDRMVFKTRLWKRWLEH